jgi:hypothetical protein
VATFLYRCPDTVLTVQGWVADDPTESEVETYEAVSCLACSRVHIVSPKTGKVLGTCSGRLGPNQRPAITAPNTPYLAGSKLRRVDGRNLAWSLRMPRRACIPWIQKVKQPSPDVIPCFAKIQRNNSHSMALCIKDKVNRVGGGWDTTRGLRSFHAPHPAAQDALDTRLADTDAPTGPIACPNFPEVHPT